MEIVKFMFRFHYKMIPISFDKYFTNFDDIYKYNFRQKAKSGYYHHSII